ncbi:MAG: hypothetical protein P8090_16515 [Gammaproteobacteria bacterium]
MLVIERVRGARDRSSDRRQIHTKKAECAPIRPRRSADIPRLKASANQKNAQAAGVQWSSSGSGKITLLLLVLTAPGRRPRFNQQAALPACRADFSDPRKSIYTLIFTVPWRIGADIPYAGHATT